MVMFIDGPNLVLLISIEKGRWAYKNMLKKDKKKEKTNISKEHGLV